MAAYKQYDVLLVNAIFDGLNLVAKEAPLVNERDGVLILSENAGAHEELGRWAITVNPFDVSAQAEAIHQALEMPADERRARIEAIRSHVREHDLDCLDRRAALRPGPLGSPRGAFVTVAAAKALTPVDPATLEPVGTVEVTPPEAIAEIVAEARLVQRRWARVGGTTSGAALLVRVAHFLLDSADDLAATITAETGKPVLEAYTAELFLALEQLRWTAANAERVVGGERVRFTQPYLRHKRGRLLYEPLRRRRGDRAVELPLRHPVHPDDCAVAAGNAVIVKPSELTPLSGAWVERAFEAVGAPRGARPRRPR